MRRRGSTATAIQGALGRPLRQTWPEAYAAVAPLYDRAFLGEAVQVPAQVSYEAPFEGEYPDWSETGGNRTRASAFYNGVCQNN